MSDQTGWFAEYDEDAPTDAKWVPMLEMRIGVVPSLDIWFSTEADCEEFIREKVIGQGMLEL